MMRLVVPDEKSHEEWEVKVSRISMFHTQPNDLQTKIGGTRTIDRLRSGSDVLMNGRGRKESNQGEGGNGPQFGDRLGNPNISQDRSLIKANNSDMDLRVHSEKPAKKDEAGTKKVNMNDNVLMIQPETGNQRGTEKKKSFYRNKTNSYKPILKQKTLRSKGTNDYSRSASPEKKVKFNKTKSVLKYNPHAGIGKRKSLKS